MIQLLCFVCLFEVIACSDERYMRITRGKGDDNREYLKPRGSYFNAGDVGKLVTEDRTGRKMMIVASCNGREYKEWIPRTHLKEINWHKKEVFSKGNAITMVVSNLKKKIENFKKINKSDDTQNERYPNINFEFDTSERYNKGELKNTVEELRGFVESSKNSEKRCPGCSATWREIADEVNGFYGKFEGNDFCKTIEIRCLREDSEDYRSDPVEPKLTVYGFQMHVSRCMLSWQSYYRNELLNRLNQAESKDESIESGESKEEKQKAEPKPREWTETLSRGDRVRIVSLLTLDDDMKEYFKEVSVSRKGTVEGISNGKFTVRLDDGPKKTFERENLELLFNYRKNVENESERTAYLPWDKDNDITEHNFEDEESETL